jgi:glutathione S-transferase
MFFAAGPVEAAVTAKSLGLLPPADKSAMVGYGSFDQVVDGLEHALDKSPWLLGERFTAADVYVGSQIAWGLMFKSLPARPAFQAYAERIAARPAAVRARAIDDALNAESKASET